MMSYGSWLIVVVIIVPAFATAQQYGCFGGNYTSNSTYAANLNSLLSSLPPNINDAGFYNASSQLPDTDPAYASALCRPDSQLDTCRSCIRNSTTELLTLCPNRTQGVLFKPLCTLRYSDESMYGLLSEAYSITALTTNLSTSDQFRADVRVLLGNLSSQAAAGGSMMKVAAGNSSGGSVFALVQCTPDLSSRDCSNCLAGLVQLLPQCCDGSTFVIMFVPSCNLHFQLDQFYNLTRLEQVRAMVDVSPPPPLPRVVPSTPSPPPGSSLSKPRTIWQTQSESDESNSIGFLQERAMVIKLELLS